MVGTLPPARLFELAVSRDFTAPRSVIIQSSNDSVSSIRNVPPSHGDFGSKNSHLAGRSNTCFHPTKAAQFLFWRGPCRLTYSVCGLRSAVSASEKAQQAPAISVPRKKATSSVRSQPASSSHTSPLLTPICNAVVPPPVLQYQQLIVRLVTEPPSGRWFCRPPPDHPLFALALAFAFAFAFLEAPSPQLSTSSNPSLSPHAPSSFTERLTHG